ncbi:MAG: hypothetical protein ACJAXK_001098 [Yoonia sp.]|jgi:hypothetical protein
MFGTAVVAAYLYILGQFGPPSHRPKSIDRYRLPNKKGFYGIIAGGVCLLAKFIELTQHLVLI